MLKGIRESHEDDNKLLNVFFSRHFLFQTVICQEVVVFLKNFEPYILARR